MSIYEDKLFVINHAYDKGGERVEVLDIVIDEKNILSNKFNLNITIYKNIRFAL